MKRSITIFHWLPRIIAILAILFIGLFALDSFDPKLSFIDQIKGFLIHLIPNFVLIVILIVAWRWEYIGGVIFTAIGLGLSPFLFSMNYSNNHSVWISLGILAAITLPFIIVGLLFIYSHFLKKRNQN